jgi:hypothetical protein
MRSVLRLPLAAAIALVCLLGTIGTAHAQVADDAAADAAAIAETAESRATCDYPVVENPFTRFGDYLDYVLAPDGSFENGAAGWQLDGGAKLVDTDKGRSLQMPEDATAISPAMCLDLNFPHFRMYHRVVKPKTSLLGGLLGLVLGDQDDARVKVEVIYHEVENPVWTEMARFDGDEGIGAGNGWRLSKKINLEPQLGGPEPGARQAALRFTVEKARDRESVLLDDIYVDPMRR